MKFVAFALLSLACLTAIVSAGKHKKEDMFILKVKGKGLKNMQQEHSSYGGGGDYGSYSNYAANYAGSYAIPVYYPMPYLVSYDNGYGSPIAAGYGASASNMYGTYNSMDLYG